MLQLLRTVSGEFLGLNRRDRDLVARYNPRRLVHATIHKLQTKELLRALEASFVQRYQQPVYDLETMLMQWLDGMGLPVEVSRMMKDRIRQTA